MFVIPSSITKETEISLTYIHMYAHDTHTRMLCIWCAALISHFDILQSGLDFIRNLRNIVHPG
jgi:hypothetical protein